MSNEVLVQVVHEQLEVWHVFDDTAPSEINAIARAVVKAIEAVK